MDVRKEIALYASEEDKAVLDWLFDHYHIDWQWRFVAYCTHQKYGGQSCDTHRVWHPTPDGLALFNHQEFVPGLHLAASCEAAMRQYHYSAILISESNNEVIGWTDGILEETEIGPVSLPELRKLISESESCRNKAWKINCIHITSLSIISTNFK